jgi:malate dehydrogenase (oxaloacetate-decarboxylating)(NADP+)
VLIFPDLQSCNIACKLLTSIGGADGGAQSWLAWRSRSICWQRGAEVEDVVNIATIAVVDAQDSAIVG